jgi:hypothetical protein
VDEASGEAAALPPIDHSAFEAEFDAVHHLTQDGPQARVVCEGAQLNQPADQFRGPLNLLLQRVRGPGLPFGGRQLDRQAVVFGPHPPQFIAEGREQLFVLNQQPTGRRADLARECRDPSA